MKKLLVNIQCNILSWSAIPYLAIKYFMRPKLSSKDGSTFLSNWHALTSGHLLSTFNSALGASREHLQYNSLGFIQAAMIFYKKLNAGFSLAKTNPLKIDEMRENLPNCIEEVTLEEKSLSLREEFDALYKEDFLPELEALEKEISGERLEFYKKIKSPEDWDKEENRQEYLALMKKALKYHKLLLKQVAILGGHNPIIMATILQNQRELPYHYAYSIFTFNNCSITDLYKDFRAKKYRIETKPGKPMLVFPSKDVKVSDERHFEVYQQDSIPCQFRELYNEACAELEKYQVLLPLTTCYKTSYGMSTDESRIVNWFKKDEPTSPQPKAYSYYHHPDQRPT